MIRIKLSGGLGNQMFQYACGRVLAIKHQTELILDTSQLNIKESDSTIRQFELENFKLGSFKIDDKNPLSANSLLYRIANVVSIRIGTGGIQTSKYFIENGYSFNSSIKIVGEDCFLVGYWQSYRYFQEIESIIREEFQFKRALDGKNMDRVNQIKNKNSVSLHVRRGDFVNNKHHDIHGTCSIEYYRKAVEKISVKVNNPYLFIFSDDTEWAQAELKNLAYPHVFVSGNTCKQSYIDMQLMSLCKHNIIANSSFSWWSAWLNANPDKIVIAPLQWFADKKMNAQTRDLIPDTWIRL